MTVIRALTPLIGVFLLGGLLSLSACKKKDDGGAPPGAPTQGVVATTPCAATCDTSYTGITGLAAPQSYVYGVNNGFCGCGPGMRPIYNSTWGYACVQASYLVYNQYLGYNTSSIYAAQNLAPTNMTQITYAPLPYGGQNNCFATAAAACNVRDVNSCGAGGFCRPIGGGSSIGVCTNQNNPGYDTYNTAYPTPYNYNSGYYDSGYNGNRCKYRTNSWGLSYWYCY